ncbi:kinesin-like protein KIF2A isoform X2 [Thrips palmi]|uniref:Kinesin-like protein n=1 Tax=Thrips palmi TaxID=161013 RepID=A0A6P8Y8M9_THRPL|nr:kinesin-like protein KIF2A isoform X2 [Thrips palmi]
MEEGLVALESGTSVNIKRTDGRIHSAVVSGVNWETRSVTVEWFERGETKGKEIEMEAILNLNADLLTTNQDEPAINNNKKVTRATRANNPTMSVASSKAPYRSTRNQSRPTNIVPAVNGHGDTGIPVPNHRVSETVAPTPTHPSAPRHTMQMSAAPLAPAPSGAPTGRSTKGGGGGTGLIESAIQNQNQNVGPAGGVGVGAAAAAAGANNAANNRRSNVVKEVERLKKNREERRQRQAELKEEKEALMNLDPGNPNWEFLAMIREYRNGIDIRPLRGSEGVEDHQITVCVRKRPLNKKELTRKEVDVITVPSRDQLVVHEPKNKVDLTKYLENAFFRFDYAFDEHCGNEIVYKYTAQPLVQTIFEGGMATCFAYGQTGSGKTHTMGGDFQGKTQDCKKGIYAMAAKDVFKYLKSPKYQPLNLVISASFFEIYSGKVFDLLADKAKLRVLEDGKQQVQIVGLTEQVVGSVEDVLKLIQHGNAARTSGQTSANSNSSRSHAVFQIVARTPGTHRVHGKFSLIDLAGNERGADTSSANRQTRMEGAEINKSLLSLKECIRALGRKNAHLPFRASKLTQVLRDSFIGEKSRTCMIAMISPGLSSCEHSLNTLRYADRVKELAANGPSENKASPEQDRGSPNAVDIGLDDSDLAQLRSLNEGEISADLYTFHEAVSQLQLQEDEVLDTHKSVLEASQRWHEMDCRLLADTRDVDYDQDAYASNLEALVTEKIDTLMQFREKVAAFRAQLLAEEAISQKMTRGPLNTRHH